MRLTPCLSGHLHIKKGGRGVHLSPDDLKELHKFLHRNSSPAITNRDKMLDKLLKSLDADAQVVDSEMHTDRDYVVRMSDVKIHIDDLRTPAPEQP